MSAKLATGAARDLQTLFEFGRVGDWTDGRLLERFRSGQGSVAEAAFTTLVHRHGPMVLRVCRGILNDEHDTQDAFQATFLVLARGAGRVRDRASVASWLHGVALRVASRAKVDAARRRTHERRAAERAEERRREEADDVFADREALDEEIHRLPEKYRAVVVLCYLEGLSHDQVAEQLRWPAGTVRGRLCRARDLLRARLCRRGLVFPAGAVTAGLSPGDAKAVPAGLIHATVGGSLGAAGKASASGLPPSPAPAAVTALADAAGRVFSPALWKVPAALLGLGLLVNTGVGVASRLGPPPVPDSPPAAARTSAAPKPEMAPDVVAGVPDDEPADGRASSAVAYPVQNIVVDGDLADWPRDIKRHTVGKSLEGQDSGYRGLNGADPADSPDLSAVFSVGYNPKDQLLYLAVSVRDDALVIGHGSHVDTDAVEVYIDGLRTDRKATITDGSWWTTTDLSKAPVQQYVAIPGEGRIYGTPYKTNSVLLAGDLSKTRTRTAYRRSGSVTTYEWAIEPFDRYPDRPTSLEPGKRIGFDLAVVDRDIPAGVSGAPKDGVDRRPAWTYWGPRWAGMKVLNAGNLGELIIAPAPAPAPAPRRPAG